MSLSGTELFGLSWQTITAFIRIGTSARAFVSPLTIDEATAVVASWLERPMVRILSAGQQHWEIFERLLVQGRIHGPLVMDAHLAALAIEHGAILYTSYLDFARFPRLKMVNPLADQ